MLLIELKQVNDEWKKEDYKPTLSYGMVHSVIEQVY